MTSQSVPDERETDAALPWVPGVVLASSYGLGGALVTGAWDTGFVVFLIATLTIAGTFVFFPRFVVREGAARRMYVHALVVTFGPFVFVHLGLIKTAWATFQDRYAAIGPESGDLNEANEVTLVLPADELMVQATKFGTIRTSFGEDGVYFAPHFPISLVYKPLHFPLSIITACSDSPIAPGYTRIRLAGTRLEVGVRDPPRRILAWCRQHGKPEWLPTD